MKAASKSGTDGEGKGGVRRRACRGKERERGMVLKVEEQPVTQPEGGEKGMQRARGSEHPERGPGGGEERLLSEEVMK